MNKPDFSLYHPCLFLLFLLTGFISCKAEAKSEAPQQMYQPNMARLQMYYSKIINSNIMETDSLILIDGNDNKLFLVSGPAEELKIIRSYDISASRYGYGAQRGSNQTPPGLHIIAGKYGHNQPLGMCFYDRRPTGEIAVIYTDSTDLEQDCVTSRILWLQGKEERNRTSYWRFIYIHGTHEEGLIGTPQSQGCIRMRNHDIIELFDLLHEGFYVYIIEPDIMINGENL